MTDVSLCRWTNQYWWEKIWILFFTFSLCPFTLTKKRYIVSLNAWLSKQLDFNDRDSIQIKHTAFFQYGGVQIFVTFRYTSFLFVSDRFVCTIQTVYHPKYSLVPCQSLISVSFPLHSLAVQDVAMSGYIFHKRNMILLVESYSFFSRFVIDIPATRWKKTLLSFFSFWKENAEKNELFTYSLDCITLTVKESV